jgi:hypothetical protein
MTDQALPDPLVPAEVYLLGLNWMELDVVRLMDSDMFAVSTGDEFKAAVALWCKSFHQRPGGSLPDNDKVLAELSRAKNWRKVKAVAMRGWIKCSDGRFYHPTVAEKVLIAWPIRQAFEEKKTGTAERKARERADRKALFGLLRANGVVPDFETPTKELRRLAEPFAKRDASGDDRDKDRDAARDSDRDKSQHVTAKTGQDLTRPDLTEENTEDFNGRSGRGPGGAELPETKAGAVGLAFKRAGVDPTTLNLGDPRLAELLRQGATPEEFEGLAREAIRQGVDSPYPWVLSVLPKRRAAAATIAIAPPPADPEAWRKGGERSIRAMAEQLGLRDVGEDEQWPAFEHRVLQAWRRKGSPAPQPRRTTA